MQVKGIAKLDTFHHDMKELQQHTKKLPRNVKRNPIMAGALAYLRWMDKQYQKRPRPASSGTFLGSKWAKLADSTLKSRDLRHPQLGKIRATGMLGPSDWGGRPDWIGQKNYEVRIGSSKVYADVHAHGSSDGNTPQRNWYKGKASKKGAMKALSKEVKRYFKKLKKDIEGR